MLYTLQSFKFLSPTLLFYYKGAAPGKNFYRVLWDSNSRLFLEVLIFKIRAINRTRPNTHLKLYPTNCSKTQGPYNKVYKTARIWTLIIPIMSGLHCQLCYNLYKYNYNYYKLALANPYNFSYLSLLKLNYLVSAAV